MAPAGDWRGKAVIVTGGSRGLGRAIAEVFASAGANVVVAARDSDRLRQAATALSAPGRTIVPVPADVTDQAQVDSLVAAAIERFGRLDVLVNNAGQSARGTLADTVPDEFQRLWDLNFQGVVRCTRAALSHLLAAKGHVVNIGSLASKAAARHLGAYPATKFALAAYSQQLRLELGPRGLHVLLVCPGPIAGEDHLDPDARITQSPGVRAEKRGAGVRVRPLSAEFVARETLRACGRRRPELVLPRRARLLFALSQISPRLGDYIIRAMT